MLTTSWRSTEEELRGLFRLFLRLESRALPRMHGETAFHGPRPDLMARRCVFQALGCCSSHRHCLERVRRFCLHRGLLEMGQRRVVQADFPRQPRHEWIRRYEAGCQGVPEAGQRGTAARRQDWTRLDERAGSHLLALPELAGPPLPG